MIISFKELGGGQGGGVTTGEVQTMIASSLTPYYTSAQTDGAINAAVSGKAETSALTNYTTTAYTQDLELSIAGALNLKEQTANKVTAITSGSTDTQYPSAKAVYNIIGNVETLLNNI